MTKGLPHFLPYVLDSAQKCGHLLELYRSIVKFLTDFKNQKKRFSIRVYFLFVTS